MGGHLGGSLSRDGTQWAAETSLGRIPHPVAEQPQGAGQLLFHAAAGDAQALGDLFVGQLLEVAEQKDFAAAGWQAEDGPVERGSLGAGVGPLGGIGPRRGERASKLAVSAGCIRSPRRMR